MRVAFSRAYWHFFCVHLVGQNAIRTPVDGQCLGKGTSALAISSAMTGKQGVDCPWRQ
jgi:hypothetical protein